MNRWAKTPAEVGKRMREKRQEAGLTQQAAAERIGVSPISVQDWERGDVMPNIANLRRAAKAYGCRMEDILAVLDKEGE